MHKLIFPFLFLFYGTISIITDSVSKNNLMSLKEWIIEDEANLELITLHNDTLRIDSPMGMTLWYNEKLEGNYTITYSVLFPFGENITNRVSDMNCFWGASDPCNADDLFISSEWRNGKFKNYNSLNLFYVGYGGNDNTTTRFRRYYGLNYGKNDSIIKPLIQEYTDNDHLLKPDIWYRVKIIVNNNITIFEVNDEPLFSYELNDIDGSGYYGLRLFNNKILFTGFRVELLN